MAALRSFHSLRVNSLSINNKELTLSEAKPSRREESPDSRKAGDGGQSPTRERWCPDIEKCRGTDPELTGFESHRDERLPKPLWHGRRVKRWQSHPLQPPIGIF